MNKNPEGILLRVADYDKIADDEVETLGVSHFGEKIGDPFQNVLKVSFAASRQGNCAVQIFLDLSKAFMEDYGLR